MLQINEFEPNLKIVFFSVAEFSLGKFSKYLIIHTMFTSGFFKAVSSPDGI